MRVPNGVLAAKCSDRWMGLRSPVTSAKPTTSEESIVFFSVSARPTARSSKYSICSGSIIERLSVVLRMQLVDLDQKIRAQACAIDDALTSLATDQQLRTSVLCHDPHPLRHQHLRPHPPRSRLLLQRRSERAGASGAGRQSGGFRLSAH